MCKLVVIPEIKQGKEAKAWKFAKAIQPYMSANDKDGFGYMALGPQGLFGERWLTPSQSFKTRETISQRIDQLVTAYSGAIEPQSAYSSFGTRSKEVSCMALHARMATSGHGLHNTHPFLAPSGDAALIHNGIINNPDSEKMPTSTCDSEVILTEYVDKGVSDYMDNINLVSASLEGYFACAVIAKDSHGNWLLDIFKDSTANLSAAYVPQLDSIVFATDINHVRKACLKLGWAIGPIFDVDDCIMIRHNALTGRVLNKIDIDPPKPRTTTFHTLRRHSALLNGDDYRDQIEFEEGSEVDETVASYRGVWGEK